MGLRIHLDAFNKNSNEELNQFYDIFSYNDFENIKNYYLEYHYCKAFELPSIISARYHCFKTHQSDLVCHFDNKGHYLPEELQTNSNLFFGSSIKVLEELLLLEPMLDVIEKENTGAKELYSRMIELFQYSVENHKIISFY